MSKSQTHFRIGRILPLTILSLLSVAVCTAKSSHTLFLSSVAAENQIVAKMNDYPFPSQLDVANVIPGFSRWFAGWWEGMIDILIITIIAALILLVLFLAFIADGLEEYFRSLDRRKSVEKKASQSVHSVWERLTGLMNGSIAKRVRPIRTRF